MISKEVAVNLQDHELTAAMITSFVQQATGFASSVRIGKNGKSVDGKSVLGVLTLGIKGGDQVVLEAEGTDEEQALEKLAGFFR